MPSFLCFSIIIVLLATISSSSNAYRFIVGGKDGWVLNPSENYTHWAQRSRFSVNDTLYFKYKNSSDSVLVVSRDDYDECKTETPISRMEGGDSEFNFDRSGPFYFISGIKQNCQEGQKLITVVLAVRNRPNDPVPSPANSPTSAVPPSPPPVNSPTSAVPPSPPSSQLPDSPLTPPPPPSPGSTPSGGGGANSTAPAGSSATQLKASFVMISTLIFVVLYRT